MLNSEKLAIAAHLHVLLRRKTGRVTDTEWMAMNAEYAAEVVRFARASAQEDGHADLAEWAAKLELAILPPGSQGPSKERLFGVLGKVAPPAMSGASDSLIGATEGEAHRYIRGIR
jgi:hypothetical protein